MRGTILQILLRTEDGFLEEVDAVMASKSRGLSGDCSGERLVTLAGAQHLADWLDPEDARCNFLVYIDAELPTLVNRQFNLGAARALGRRMLPGEPDILEVEIVSTGAVCRGDPVDDRRYI